MSLLPTTIFLKKVCQRHCNIKPKRTDCGIPKISGGVGVAFKLVQALLQSVDYPIEIELFCRS